MVGIATSFVCLGQELSVYHKLSWTILGDIFCRGQYRLVYQPVLSVMDKIGWYFTHFCLSWTRLVGILTFICHGQ